MIESVLIAILGGAAGLLVALFGDSARWLLLHPAGLPRLADIRIDGAVLGFTLGACVLTALLFGLIPAIQVVRLNLNDTLKDAARGSSEGRGQTARRLLVVSEFALSLVLLIGAGLLIRSFVALQRVQPGFNAEKIVSFGVSIPGNRYPKNEDITRFVHELELKMAALPGVESVGSTFQLPLTGSGARIALCIQRRNIAEVGEHFGRLAAHHTRIFPHDRRALARRPKFHGCGRCESSAGCDC